MLGNVRLMTIVLFLDRFHTRDTEPQRHTILSQVGWNLLNRQRVQIDDQKNTRIGPACPPTVLGHPRNYRANWPDGCIPDKTTGFFGVWVMVMLLTRRYVHVCL